MSEYFSYFPTVTHDLTDEGKNIELTNILRRFIIRSSVKDRADVFYEYDVQAGDRPDTIANKYYGDSDLAWIVLHFNDIVDPIFGWTIFDYDFDQYIRGKYGSVPDAQREIHEYRRTISEAVVKPDGTRVPKRYVVIDKDTYDSLVGDTSREAVSKYDWEIEENDKKRKIRLLDKRYLDKIKDEVKDILRNSI
jgi:hypothetical protein